MGDHEKGWPWDVAEYAGMTARAWNPFQNPIRFTKGQWPRLRLPIVNPPIIKHVWGKFRENIFKPWVVDANWDPFNPTTYNYRAWFEPSLQYTPASLFGVNPSFPQILFGGIQKKVPSGNDALAIGLGTIIGYGLTGGNPIGGYVGGRTGLFIKNNPTTNPMSFIQREIVPRATQAVFGSKTSDSTIEHIAKQATSTLYRAITFGGSPKNKKKNRPLDMSRENMLMYQGEIIIQEEAKGLLVLIEEQELKHMHLVREDQHG